MKVFIIVMLNTIKFSLCINKVAGSGLMLKTFLINLDRRPDRLEYVTKQLDELGIGFERVVAIDGKGCSAEQLRFFDRDRFVLECKKKPVMGEIGCALSHRLVWQQMVTRQIPYALILEDDIKIDPRLKLILSNPEYYQKFDFFNLALKEPFDIDIKKIQSLVAGGLYCRPYFWQRRRRRIWRQMESETSVSWQVFHLSALDGEMFACECNPAPALACCYIVSLHAARQFLATSENMFYPIDKVWRYSGGLLREAVLTHSMALQVLDSDIRDRNFLKLTVWQKIRRFIFKGRFWRRHWDVIRLYGWSRF